MNLTHGFSQSAVDLRAQPPLRRPGRQCRSDIITCSLNHSVQQRQSALSQEVVFRGVPPKRAKDAMYGGVP